MRIGIDCRLWNETGVGRYTRNLVSELLEIDRRNEYTLFALSKNSKEIKNEIAERKNENWKVVSVDIRWHTAGEQVEFPKYIKKEQLDLVHFPYFSVPVFYNRPFVVTVHDLIINHFPTGQASTLPYPLYWLKLQGYKYVIARAAKQAKKVITVSNATKQEVIDHLRISPEKIVVTYEGVSKEIIGQAKHESSEDIKNYFLYVGNAYPHKNLSGLLGAFSIIRQDHPELLLVLVGRDDFFYRKLRKTYESTPGVVFRRADSDQELAWYYRHAKAFVMPSFMEGFGLPPLEAMANGCVVVASDIPSLREICDNAAIYFDPGNISEMAEKMNDALSLSSQQKGTMIANGRKRAEQFSWTRMAEETLRVYESSFYRV